MSRLMRDRSGMGAVNLLAPSNGVRRLGTPDILRDEVTSEPIPVSGTVTAPDETLILGLFTPVQALLAVAAAWFLFKK